MKEVELFNSFDIGIMPVPDNEWSKGNVVRKVLYMSVGIPAVMSGIGMNKKLFKMVKMVLANSPSEWVDLLSKLIENQDLRKKLDKLVEKRFLKTILNVVKETYFNLYSSLIKKHEKNSTSLIKYIKLGARMVPLQVFMPIQYSGVNQEHNNVRNNVGVFDVSHMGEFTTGEHALELIQKFSNDASKLFRESSIFLFT